jgi:hypothetical protein
MTLKKAYIGALGVLAYLGVCAGIWLTVLLIWSLVIGHIDDATILFAVLLLLSLLDYLLIKYGPRE